MKRKLFTNLISSAFFVSFLFLLAPFVALASSHEYTCSDFQFAYDSNATCSGGVIHFSAGETGFIDSNSSVNPPGAGGTANFPLTRGTTYYVYVSAPDSTGNVSLGSYYYEGGGNFGSEINNVPLSSSAFTYSFSAVRPESPATSGSGLYFANNSGGGDYVGHLGPICISDVSAIDALNTCVSPSPPGPAGVSPFDEIFGIATTTASSTVSIVDNPTQDFFNGVILFLVMMWGVIFWFKKR